MSDSSQTFNMADYFLYHNVEEGRENKVCLYYEDRRWTYGEVARLSNQTGNALRDLGLDVEDRVLLVLPDCPEFVWTWFGAARIGAVITMVNPLLPAIDPNGPSLETALQEQLGLKLDSERGSVEVLVIEKLSPPTEN